MLNLHGIGSTLVSPGFVDTRIPETTRRLDPAETGAAEMDPEHREKWERFEGLFEPFGHDPDEVSNIVLDAIHLDRLYCQPDRLIVEHIQARCQALLEAMPKVAELERKMAEMIEHALQQRAGISAVPVGLTWTASYPRREVCPRRAVDLGCGRPDCGGTKVSLNW